MALHLLLRRENDYRNCSGYEWEKIVGLPSTGNVTDDMTLSCKLMQGLRTIR